MWYSKTSSLRMLEPKSSLHLTGLLNLSQTLYVATLLFLLQLWELVPLALLLSLQLLLEERKERRLLREGELLEQSLENVRRRNGLKEKRGELLEEEVLEEVRLGIQVRVLKEPNWFRSGLKKGS